MKAIAFKDLPVGALFRVFAEKKFFYENGERKFGMVKSNNPRVYKKHGPGVSSTKDGKDIILALNDLVIPYEKREPVPARAPGMYVKAKHAKTRTDGGKYVRH